MKVVCELTKGEVELLNAYNSLHSTKKSHVIQLVKQFAKENERPKPKYNNKTLMKKKKILDSDKPDMILNGVPGKCSYEGYCYIGIDKNWTGFYKIGRTVDPTCKSRQSRSINPNYVIIFRTKNLYQDSKKLELDIFEELANFRCSKNNCNEWFELSENKLTEIVNKYNFIGLSEL